MIFLVILKQGLAESRSKNITECANFSKNYCFHTKTLIAELGSIKAKEHPLVESVQGDIQHVVLSKSLHLIENDSHISAPYSPDYCNTPVPYQGELGL